MRVINKVLSSLKNIHLQSLLGNGVMAAFGMLTMALLYRALSLKDIGLYVFFMAIFGLIDTLRSGFLTTSFIKFYSGTNDFRAREVAGSAWAIALFITAILVLVNAVIYILPLTITDQGILLLVNYFSFISIATLPTFMSSLVLQADRRFDRYLWVRLINQVLFTGTVVVLMTMNSANLQTVIISYTLCNLITSIIIMVFGWSRIKSLRYTTKQAIKQLFDFGKYSVGTYVSSNLFKVIDTFFISYFLGPAALAIYNLSGKLIQLVEMPLLSFASSGMPSLSGYYNNNEKDNMMYVMKKMIGIVSIMILIIALLSIVFAEPIILLIGGEKYLETEAVNLLRIFMIMTVLYPADRYFGLTLDVIHMPKINFYKILCMLAVNLIADYIGILLFKSVYAIGIANIFPLVLSILIAYVPLNKYNSFNFWNMYVIGYTEMKFILKRSYNSLFF
jgi:O-antigen/teichoic acid export membrane protein